MILEILTPDQKVFSGEVSAVNLPGSEGNFEVLTGHAAIISNLNKGDVTIRNSGKEQKITINGGIVEVLHNKIIVLADAIIS